VKERTPDVHRSTCRTWQGPAYPPPHVTVALLSLAIALGAAVAFASWTVNGGGTGAAQATSAQNLVVSNAAPTAQLYPGFTGGDLYITVNNPNPFQVTINRVDPTAGTIGVTGSVGTCSDTGVSFAAVTGLSLVAPPGNSTHVVPGSALLGTGVSMSNASDSGCQGGTFSIPVTVQGASS
jgi:hypothetical protein